MFFPLLFGFSLVAAFVAASPCGDGRCTDYTRGVCVPSQRGARCSECSGLGFLDYPGGACVCYGDDKDPVASKCMPAATTNFSLVVNYKKTRRQCVCYDDDANGHFFQIDLNNSQHVYGEPNPPTCDRCPLSPAFGPKPGQVVATEPGAVKACTQYGAPDPDFLYSAQNDDSWRVCAGHGYWNAATYSCVPNDGWQLINSGMLGRNGTEVVMLPLDCVRGHGPSPTLHTVYSPPYCKKVFTVDPIDGISKECGGHGIEINGACACFYNSTAGRWNLTTIDGVQTCALAT